MPDTTPIERALCCGATCGRGTEAAGPCIAAVYGRKKHTDLKAAGYVVAPKEPTREMWRDSADALVKDPHGAGSGAHHDHISGIVYRAMIRRIEASNG